MSSASFGTVNATGLNVTGILQASQISTTQPMQVSNLTASGPVSIQGDLTVSGNIYGTFANTVADVLNKTGLIPYGTVVPDSQDVFARVNTVGSGQTGTLITVTGPLESDIKINVALKNQSGTAINHGTRIIDDKSYLVSFPTGNVFAPTWTALTDPDIEQKYANIYANAPINYPITTHYSLQEPRAFPQETYNTVFDSVIKYYTDRGYTLPTPDYTTNYNNMYVTQMPDTSGLIPNPGNGSYATIAIEFNELLPSNLYLSCINTTPAASRQLQENCFYGAFLPAYNNVAVTNSNIFIRPTVVPVTTNPSVFASAYGRPTASQALYDPVKREIHIYFSGSSNTVATGNTTSAFNAGTGTSATWSEVCELSYFSGSFAIAKKRADITPSTRPFATATSADEKTFLYQISSNLVVTSNMYKNGSKILASSNYTLFHQYFSATFTNALYKNGAYNGATISKVGFGSNDFDVMIFSSAYPNANATFQPVRFLGPNQYAQISAYQTTPSVITVFNNVQSLSTAFPVCLDSNVYNYTPEMGYSNVTSNSFVLDELKTIEIVNAHEMSHALRDFNDGVAGLRSLMNVEGHACSAEMLYGELVSNTLSMIRNELWVAYLQNFHRGALPLERGFHIYEGDLHTVGGTAGRVRGTFSALNGESLFYQYIVKKYDTNQQIERYFNDLFQQRVKECLIDGGFPEFVTGFAGLNTKVAHLVYDQALQSITTAQGSRVTLANVFVDYTVMTALLRNNTTIPAKYRSTYPYWLLNRRAPWWNYTKNTWSFAFTDEGAFWSDALEGIPLGNWSRYASTYGDAFTLLDTMTPIYPKTGYLGTSIPYSNGPAKNNLGSWNNANTQDAWTYTSNSYTTDTLVHQAEDMAAFVYTMPIFSDVSNVVYGTSNYVSNVAITVTRGDWVFKVVQFVPDGAQGTYIESADIPINITDDTFTLPSTWSGGTPQTIDINFSTIATTTTTASGTTSTTGFQKYCHGTDYNGVHVWYFPRLVCVNHKNYDYGQYRNVFPRNCIYTGYMTMKATVV
jgi:hypothetical protein